MASVLIPPLITRIREEFQMDWDGIHGAAHWSRVRVNGLFLASMNDVNPAIVEYFSFLHDVCRENDDDDEFHGDRAVEFAHRIRRDLITLDADDFELLTTAMSGHTNRQDHPHPAIQTCWDADRLDLGRCGIIPDPKRLCTEIAKSPAVIKNATLRAHRWLEKNEARLMDSFFENDSSTRPW